MVSRLMFACGPVKTASVAESRVQVRKSPGTDAEGKMESELSHPALEHSPAPGFHSQLPC